MTDKPAAPAPHPMRCERCNMDFADRQPGSLCPNCYRELTAAPAPNVGTSPAMLEPQAAMLEPTAAPAPEPVATVDYLVRAETNHPLRYMVEAPHALRKGQPLYAHLAAPAPEPKVMILNGTKPGWHPQDTPAAPAPDAEDETKWATHYAVQSQRLYDALQALVNAYSNKHSPQHRAAALVEAQTVLKQETL